MATLLKIQPLRESQNLLPKSVSEFGDESGAMNGPFRATQRWNSIIKHLQDNVHTKTHKTKTKRYAECFAGADAVDVLLPYLKLQHSGFERDISRENAIKLCQLLLEQNIFEDVQTLSQLPPHPKPAFQDNNANFYRFVRSSHNGLRKSQRFSDTSRHQKGSTEDMAQNYPQFDRKKKLRSSFGAGKSKNDNRCDENEAGGGLSHFFDRKKKKRASFGLGKLKADVFSRSDDGNLSETPLEKRKRKRSSFGMGKLKSEFSYNISGSVESIPQSGDKRRASFRLKRKTDTNRCSDASSQESLSLPERKRGRRSFGSFRLGKKTDTKHKDTETASVTSDTSRQSDPRCQGSSIRSGSDHYDGESLTSQDSLKDDLDVNEIWKESTIQRLLELVDIPLLEDVLSCTDNFRVPCFPSGSETTNGTSCQDRTTSDAWLSTALACLHSHPECSTITASFLSANNCQTQSSIHARKLLLFQTLTNHYAGTRRRPLIPTELQEVLASVLDSIARGKTSRALELTQLALMMLEAKGMDEIRRLLQFMATASSKTAVKLSYEVDNRITIITTFTPVILPSDILSPVQAKNLVAFMMDCVSRIFKVPQLVAEKAAERIRLLKAGLGDTGQGWHCIQITSQEYHRQSAEGTDTALRDLTNTIIDDVQIPLRDKKQHLQDLKKHHPKVYDKNFADML